MTRKKRTSSEAMITGECPFCGSCDMHITLLAAKYRVNCRSCDVAGPSAGTEDNAIRLWNARAEDWP